MLENARKTVSFYGAGTQFNVCLSLRHVLHVLFLLYTRTSRLPRLALTQCHDVHSPTQEATGSVKASSVFFVFHFSTSEIDSTASCAASHISIDCMQGHGTAQQVQTCSAFLLGENGRRQGGNCF